MLTQDERNKPEYELSLKHRRQQPQMSYRGDEGWAGRRNTKHVQDFMSIFKKQEEKKKRVMQQEHPAGSEKRRLRLDRTQHTKKGNDSDARSKHALAWGNSLGQILNVALNLLCCQRKVQRRGNAEAGCAVAAQVPAESRCTDNVLDLSEVLLWLDVMWWDVSCSCLMLFSLWCQWGFAG